MEAQIIGFLLFYRNFIIFSEEIITMVTKEIFRSVPGILRPFKEYLRSRKIADGDQIVYYGCVGTCTPFVELLAMSMRGMHLEQVFVPLLDEFKAKKIIEIPEVGMQVCGVRPSCIPG